MTLVSKTPARQYRSFSLGVAFWPSILPSAGRSVDWCVGAYSRPDRRRAFSSRLGALALQEG